MLGLSKQVVRASLVALVPISGYVVAFSYEWGYCSYFGVPLELIQLTLTNGFIAIIALALGILLFSYAFSVLDIIFTDNFNAHLGRLAPPWLIATVYVGIYLDIFAFGYWLMFTLCMFYTILPFLRFLGRRFILRPLRAERTGQAETADNPTRFIAPAASLRRTSTQQFPYFTLDAATFKFCIACILAVIVPFDLGYRTASSQRRFYTNADKFVVRIYGDNVVEMRFYSLPASKSRPGVSRVERSLILQKINDTNSLTFDYDNIGPLTFDGEPKKSLDLAPWNPDRLKHPLAFDL